VESTQSCRNDPGWLRAICYRAAVLAGAVLLSAPCSAQLTGTAYTPGPVLSYGNQLNVKVANLGSSAAGGFLLLFNASGQITFDGPFNLAASRMTDIVVPTVPGEIRVPVLFVRDSDDAFRKLSLDLYQTDTTNNVVQIPDRYWMSHESSVLGATSIVFGPKQLGHFEFVGDFKHYSPGPIRAVLSTALLHVFNYGAAPILLQMVCNDSFGQAIPGCATQVSIPSLQTRQVQLTELPANVYPVVRVTPATAMFTLLMLQALGTHQQIYNADWQRRRISPVQASAM